MRVYHLHPWDVDPAEAVRLQEALRSRVVAEDCLGEVHYVAGADVHVRGDTAYAAVAVLRYPDLTLVEVARAAQPVHFPYIPGLLAFREAPAILAACQQLQAEPDLLLCDGHGLAHPRRLGLASHLGLFLDRPTIGCAKSRLCGRHDTLPPEAGTWVPLDEGGEIIGAVVRTRPGGRPLYVSVGHRVSLESAVHYVLATLWRPPGSAHARYRLPEPCRLAHLAARP